MCVPLHWTGTQWTDHQSFFFRRSLSCLPFTLPCAVPRLQSQQQVRTAQWLHDGDLEGIGLAALFSAWGLCIDLVCHLILTSLGGPWMPWTDSFDLAFQKLRKKASSTPRMKNRTAVPSRYGTALATSQLPSRLSMPDQHLIASMHTVCTPHLVRFASRLMLPTNMCQASAPDYEQTDYDGVHKMHTANKWPSARKEAKEKKKTKKTALVVPSSRLIVPELAPPIETRQNPSRRQNVHSHAKAALSQYNVCSTPRSNPSSCSRLSEGLSDQQQTFTCRTPRSAPLIAIFPHVSIRAGISTSSTPSTTSPPSSLRRHYRVNAKKLSLVGASGATDVIGSGHGRRAERQSRRQKDWLGRAHAERAVSPMPLNQDRGVLGACIGLRLCLCSSPCQADGRPVAGATLGPTGNFLCADLPDSSSPSESLVGRCAPRCRVACTDDEIPPHGIADRHG